MNPGLYVVGTPIGNLQDITLRALDVLKTVSLILAEDTRHTRILLERHGIQTPLLSVHKFNEASRIDEVLNRLRAGAAIALVSDSGMPAVSDPGARIVAACRAAGHAVYVVPGPSAVTAAVAAAGFPARGFVFGGFLPQKPGPRRRALSAFARAGLPIVLFESPHRLIKLLEEIESLFGAVRVYVGRELTKRFEEHRCGTPADLRAHFAARGVKGEFVVMIEGAEPDSGKDGVDAGDSPPESSDESIAGGGA